MQAFQAKDFRVTAGEAITKNYLDNAAIVMKTIGPGTPLMDTVLLGEEVFSKKTPLGNIQKLVDICKAGRNDAGHVGWLLMNIFDGVVNNVFKAEDLSPAMLNGDKKTKRVGHPGKPNKP